MLTININDVPFQMPENWQEIISTGKYLDVIEHIITIEDAPLRLYEIFKTLTGFNVNKIEMTENGRIQLSSELVATILPKLSFIFDEEELFVKNPIPTFTHDGVVYTGPSDRLNNQTGFQWEITHHLQVMYAQTQDSALLEKIVYANYTADRKPEQYTALPPSLVYGIYLWYGKCEKWWGRQYPWLFPDPDDIDITRPAEPTTGREIKEMLFKLAGSKLNADYDIVRARTRPDILFALDEMEKERERIEAQRTH